ncbi:MAG: tetratricopeptide repeat protein [Deltaproteobacteria bacterium]|nr:tetratricopeptide repeat protein [Deltaproteobacteria bacterium]MBN2670030.1 tetratricopeptide repeat protein [Deltaproteobacteria bacterium]
MKERIKSLVTSLEHDPKNTDILAELEEIVTGEELPENLDEIAAEFRDGVQRLMSAGRFETASSILEIQTVLAASEEEEASLLLQQAKILDEEMFEQEQALAKLERVAAILTDDEDVQEKVTLIRAERSRYSEIVATFKEQAEAATDSSLKAHMLYSAAERLYKNEKDSDEIMPLLNGAIEEDPTHQKAARLLERIYETSEDWRALGELYLSLAKKRKGKNERLQMYLAAGYTFAHRLDDKEEAVRCFAEVLDYQPGQKTALQFLVKYYEEREDWDHLVAVYEDTLHGKLEPEDEIAACMQVGMVHWRFREDMASAEQYFKRLARLAPAHPGMLDFYRQYAEETESTATLLKVLENALRVAESKEQKEKLTREVAQLSEDAGNVEKAIDAWKKVLRKEPENNEAQEQLKTLYRQSGKWNNLIDILKSELEEIDDSEVDEKIAKYEEMAAIYQDELSLEMMVIKVYHSILELAPDRISALESLMAAYKTAGRWNDLIKILTKRVEVASDDDERIRFLNQIAELWVGQFNNFNKAVEPLERILDIDPENAQAISTLKDIYEKRRSWKPLMGLLEKELSLTEEDDVKARILREMAETAQDKLNDHDAAIELWWKVYETGEDQAAVLSTLEKLTERKKDWDGVARVLDIRIEASEDDDEKISLLTKLGTVHKDRSKEPAAAAEAWKKLLEIDPKNPKALRSLKEAYQEAEDWNALEELFSEAGDFETLVEVFGIAADRTKDRDTKIQLSFRCAEIYDDQIGQPDRAVRHYERVLSVDEKNIRAATALIPIYRRAEKWSRLLGVLELTLESIDDKDERVLRIDELRELSATKVNNRELAFKWAVRAFEEMPNDNSIRETLEAAAEQAHAFERLVEIYKKNIDHFKGKARVNMEKHIASLSLDKLGDVDDAIEQYNSVLNDNPKDENALLALDSIYRSTGKWTELEKVFEARIENADDDEDRRNLIMEMAQMHEEAMDDSIRAAAKYRSVLEIDAGDSEALEALERIFQDSERFSDLAEILESQKQMLTPGDDQWREKAFQLAAVSAQHLDEKGRAVSIYQEILATSPQDAEAISALDVFLRDPAHQYAVAQILEPHLVEMEDWKRLAWALSILIENTRELFERVALNIRLADIYAQKLDDERLAFETICAAMAEEPNDMVLWDKLTTFGTHLGVFEELGQRLQEAFDSDNIEDDIKLKLAQKLALFYDEELGKPEVAERFHKLILAEIPDSVESFNALEQFYTSMEKWDMLLELYHTAKDNDSYTGGHLELLVKICFVVYEVQHDVAASIRAYNDVLEEDPENEDAFFALISLYEESERWDDLTGILTRQLETATETTAVGIKYRIGEIAEQKLQNYEDAIVYYEQVIEADPENMKTQKALERMLEIKSMKLRAAKLLSVNYEHQGAAGPLANVLMIMLEDKDLDAAEKVDILLKVANIRERRLGDEQGAFDALGAALKAEPDNNSVFGELSRLAVEQNFNEQFCDLLNDVVKKIDDDLLIPKFMLAVAETYDERIGDLGKAQQAYMRLLDYDPESLDTAIPSIDALDRIYSGEQNIEELLTILRTKVDLLSSPEEQKEVLHRMAGLEETMQDNAANAIDLFKEILEIDDTDIQAMSGLERLYTLEENWTQLISVLQNRAMYENDVDRRRDLLLRVAGLFEEKLEKLGEAIDAYTQANDETGAHLTSLAALEKLYTKTERWSDLFDSYQLQLPLVDDDAEKADLYYKIGYVLEDHLNEPEDAVVQFGMALEIDPRHVDTRLGLERLLETSAKSAAIDLLKPIAEAEGNHVQLVKYLIIQADLADDPQEKSELFARAAEISEVGLDDTNQAFEFYCKAVRHGSANAELNELLDNVERLMDMVGGQKQVATLYAEVAPDVLDGDLQVRCYLQVAELSYRQLDDVSTAREYYLKIMDANAENEEAMNALEEIYRASEEYLELFEIYRQKVQNVFDDDLRKDILFKQAQVCEDKLDDISGAVQTYESILEIDQTNAEAIASLERLYPQEDRWNDLVELLENRRSNEPQNSVELACRLGQLIHDKLGDEDHAFDVFREALTENPEHGQSIALLESYMQDEDQRGRVAELLEPVYSHQGNWEKLAEVLDARLETCDDTIERKELLQRIGTVYEEQLGNLEKAFDTFARLFKEEPEDNASKELLTRLAGVLENWDKLAEVLAEVLDDVVGDTPETAELAFLLGGLYENRLSEPAKAKDAYKRVMAFDPDDARAFDAVERVLLAIQDWEELLLLYRTASEAAVDMDQQKAFLFKMAEIHENALNDKDAAIDIFREVLEIDDQDERTIDALDRLYYQTERFGDLADHFRNQIDLASGTGQRNALRRELAKIQEENIGDLNAAVDLYEEAISEAEGDRGSVSHLERLILNEDLRERIADILEPVYRETDEWKKLVVILQTQEGYLDSPGERVEKLREIAMLHETRGQNYLLAFEALSRAFVADPQDRMAYDDMCRLVEGIENYEDFAAGVAEAVDEVYDLDFKKDLLLRLGATYDLRLDMPRKAIDAFTQVLEIDETDMEALNALEGLYNLVGDWDALVTTLGKKADQAADPESQCDLLRAKGAIQEDLIADLDAAIDTYVAALDANPASLDSILALERLYESKSKWAELVDIKRQHLEMTVEVDARKEIASVIAQLYENKLNDAFEAINAWRMVLDDNPQDIEAILALDRLYAKEGNFADLLDNLRLQKELANDQAAWVDLTLRIGDLQRTEMSDLEGAIDSYRDVLAQQPTHAEAIARLEELARDESVRMIAIEVLEPLHEDAGRYDKLVAINELKLEVLDDPQDRLQTLLGMAELHMSGRSVPKDAFDTYVRALKEEPSRLDTVLRLEQIAQAEDMYKQLAEVYESVAADVYEPEAEKAILMKLGEIKEVQMGDRLGAIDAYRRVFDNGDTSVEVLSALDRLYEREEKWTELDEILEQEIQNAADMDDINRLKLRQGMIKEDKFEDHAGAISVYRDVVEASAQNDEAIHALEKMLKYDEFVVDISEILSIAYQQRGEEHKIARLLESKLAIADDDVDKVELYRELATHQEQVAGDSGAAFDVLAKAFALVPDDSELIYEIERLAEVTGSWSALVDLSEKAVANSKIDPEAKIEIGLKIAGWAYNQVGDLNKAESLYKTVLERDPEHQEALAALVELLRSLGRFKDLLPVLQKQADVAYDFAKKKEVLTQAAQISRIELNDQKGAIGLYKQILENDDSDLDALDSLIELNEEVESFKELVELLLSRASFTSEPSESNRFRHRAATLYMGPLSKTDKGVDVYREILEMDPNDNEAVNMLEAAFENEARWTDLQEIYQHRLDIAESEGARVDVLRLMAKLSEQKFEEYDDAAERWNEIVLVRPEDDEAISALERIYSKQERWQDLVDLYEDQANRATDRGDGSTELRLLVQSGEILQEKLSDSVRATEIYERVLERDANHTRALSALAKLYEADGDWDKVAEVLNQAAATGGGGEDAAEVHYRLALLNEQHREDADAALTSLRKAVSLFPAHFEANQKLAEICKKSGDYNGLLEALMRQEMAIENDKEKFSKLVEIAAVQADHLNDAVGSVATLEKAYELDKSNKDVLLKLSDAYVHAGQSDKAIPVMEDLIDAETNGGRKRSKTAAAYHEKLAKALLAKGDGDGALDHLEQAYKMDISNTDVLVSLGKLHYDREEFDKAAKLFRALLLQRFTEAGGLTKADIYFFVGDIQLRQGDPKKAKGMFRRGLDEDKDHAGCKEGMEKC